MVNQYMISATSEIETNEKLMTLWFEEGVPLFTKNGDWIEFGVELYASDEHEISVIKAALSFKRFYQLDDIQVWKKERDSKELYARGLSFHDSDDNIELELLLGEWSDWMSGRLLDNMFQVFTEKDQQLL